MPKVVEFLGVDVEELSTRDVQQILTRSNFQGHERELFLESWEKRSPSALTTLAQALEGFCWIHGEWRRVTREDVVAAAEKLDSLARQCEIARDTHAAFYAQAGAAAEKAEFDRDPAAYRAARSKPASGSPGNAVGVGSGSASGSTAADGGTSAKPVSGDLGANLAAGQGSGGDAGGSSAQSGEAAASVGNQDAGQAAAGSS